MLKWRSIVSQFTSSPIGDGVATSFVITHGLNTRNVTVRSRLVASPYTISTPLTASATTADTVTVTYSAAPASGAAVVIVQGAA